MGTMNFFKTILLVQLFFSFVITTISYAIPDDALNYVTGFSGITQEISLDSVSEDVQDSMETQTNIPVIELGALVFYSGNILLDLMLNFAFAIPEMIGLLLSGLMLLFSFDTALIAIVELFASVAITVMYMLGLMQLVTGIRSGTRGVA